MRGHSQPLTSITLETARPSLPPWPGSFSSLLEALATKGGGGETRLEILLLSTYSMLSAVESLRTSKTGSSACLREAWGAKDLHRSDLCVESQV